MPKKRKTILFIEDDPDQQKMYRFTLRKAGYRFVQASSGEAGLKAANVEKPDLILLDILMNGMSGIETLRQLKKSPETKHIPVVIFTNYTKEEALQEVLALGAAEVIIKTDVVPKDVVDKIEAKYLPH